MEEAIPQGALEDLTVLDLASEMTAYGTRILAELGAEVLRIEPTAGERLRYRAPYYHGKEDPEGSLSHLHYNLNKRGLTLDITHPRGAELLRSLAKTADILFEGFAPGYLDSLGLGYEQLRAVNPRLIMVSVTPFGQQGPHNQYLATDLIGVAMGGWAILNGYPDDRPTIPAAEQAYHMAGMTAATAAMIAVCSRDASSEGAGTHLDIAMQDCIAMVTLQTANAGFYSWHGTVPKRKGIAGGRARHIFPCRDGGWISLVISPRFWEDFVAWLREFGLDGEVGREAYRDLQYRTDHPEPVAEATGALAARFTQEEIYHEAQSRRLQCMKVNSVADLLVEEQLNSRGFFVEVDYPEWGERLQDAGPAGLLSETPGRIHRRAPRLGEDNEAIYGKRLGLSADEIASLRSARVI